VQETSVDDRDIRLVLEARGITIKMTPNKSAWLVWDGKKEWQEHSRAGAWRRALWLCNQS